MWDTGDHRVFQPFDVNLQHVDMTMSRDHFFEHLCRVAAHHCDGSTRRRADAAVSTWFPRKHGRPVRSCLCVCTSKYDT
jgi:hypothetical protein